MINTEESFVLVDTDLNIAAFNDQFKKLYLKFYGKEVRKAESILNYAQPDRLELVKQIYQKVFSGEKQESEIKVPNPDKSIRIYLLKYKPAFDEKGEVIGAFVSCFDITEKKRTEEQLKQSEERFKLFMKYTPALAWLTDEDGKLVYANEPFLNSLNLNEDTLGKSIFDIFPEEIAKPMHKNNLDVIQSNKNIETIEIVPDPTGEMHHYSVYKFPIPNLANKKVAGGLAIDVTDKLTAEEKLKQNEERLRTIIDNEPECVKVVDKNGILLDMNSAGLSMIEAENLEEVKNQNVMGLIHPDDKYIYLDAHTQACNGKKGIARFRVIGLKKTMRWMEMHYVPLKDSENKIYAALSVTRDITKQIKAEEEKEFERKDKEALINSSKDAMWSVSKDFKLLAANNAFIQSLRNLIGITLKPGDNLLLNEFFPNEFISFWEKLYIRGLTGETYQEEVYFPPMKDVPEEWKDISFNPIYNESQVIGIACYARDITERKRYEQELLELNEQIKRKVDELAISNRDLEQFAYIASHDLQEPLRMVTSFLTLLEKKYKDLLDEKAHEYIYFAVDGAIRMRKIILDLLEYSRVGRQNYKIESVSLEDLILEIKILNQNTILEKKAEIFSENLPRIVCSKTSILQVLQNLIGNALKYQKKNTNPKIEISANETESHWEVIVSDNGIGIDPKFFEKIFIIFQRLHTKDEYSGSGIGLAICKKIIENHQGKLWVESEIGKGSNFHFTISKKLTSQ